MDILCAFAQTLSTLYWAVFSPSQILTWTIVKALFKEDCLHEGVTS